MNLRVAFRYRLFGAIAVAAIVLYLCSDKSNAAEIAAGELSASANEMPSPTGTDTTPGLSDFSVATPVSDSAGPELVWNKTYGDTGNYYTSAVTVTETGHIIAVGNTFDSDGASHGVFVISVDQLGNLDWLRVLDSDGDERAQGVIESGGVLTVIGTHRTSLSGPKSLHFLRLSTRGDLLFDTVMSSLEGRSFSNIAPAPGGDCYVAGTDWYRIDNRGRVVWTHHTSAKFQTAGLAAVPGGFVCSGTYNSVDPYPHRPRDGAWIVRGDSLGNTDSTWTYGFSMGWCIASRPDRGFYFATSHSGMETFVLAVDSDFSESWATSIETPRHPRLVDLDITSDGGCLAVGYTGLRQYGNQNVWVSKIRPDGASAYNVEIASGPEDDIATAVVPAGDGTMIVAGQSESFNSHGSSQIYLLKLRD